jgi:L-ribulose-5-phosphate 4-epimerase
VDFEALREEVLAANLALPEHGLVKLTWGNVSGVDREAGVMAIKPSGVPYDGMTAQDIVLVDVASGEVVGGERRPSSDTPTHVALYRALEDVGGIVHTHSTYATVWAQAGREIPVLGTTHADFSAQPVPITRSLTSEEVDRAYEEETGTVILETVGGRAEELPAVLVRGHAPFCWAATAAKAVEAAVTLEEVARLALYSRLLEPDGPRLDDWVRDKHHDRKHGSAAYYGQD